MQTRIDRTIALTVKDSKVIPELNLQIGCMLPAPVLQFSFSGFVTKYLQCIEGHFLEMSINESCKEERENFNEGGRTGGGGG